MTAHNAKHVLPITILSVLLSVSFQFWSKPGWDSDAWFLQYDSV